MTAAAQAGVPSANRRAAAAQVGTGGTHAASHGPRAASPAARSTQGAPSYDNLSLLRRVCHDVCMPSVTRFRPQGVLSPLSRWVQQGGVVASDGWPDGARPAPSRPPR